MNKKEVGQLYYIKKERKMWEKELDKLINTSYAKGQEITGMPTAKGSTSDKTAKRAITQAELTGRIVTLKEMAAVREQKIMEYIESIPDSRDRQIVYMRAVKNYSFGRIAKDLGGGNTEDGIRKRYNRILKK